MIICTHQKKKIEVSHENVIEKPKHFHWKPMHNEQLENLMITFLSSTLKDITNFLSTIPP